MFFLNEFINKDLEYIKQTKISNKIILGIFCFLPVFIIIGTALSEFVIIILCLKYISDFFFKKFKTYSKSLLIFLILIYISLLVNQIFSVNYENSFLRNIFFIKYLIFVIGTINFFSNKKVEFLFIIKIWFLIMTFFSIDLIIQFITHKNLIGLESPLKYQRLSGFMGNELKAGSLILSFGFIISGYFISNDKYKIIGLILLMFFVVIIFLTGDRSNFFKSIIILFSLIFFMNKKLLNKSIILLLTIICLFIYIVNTNNVFKDRFKNKIFDQLLKNNFNIIKYVENTEYGKIYKTSYELFIEKKLFGVGNKNFRILCEKNYEEKYPFTKEINEPRCNTHPHQIYFEILSEHGIFGLSILIISLIGFIYQNLGLIFKSKDFLLISFFLSILILFVPVLPSGSFFTSFNATLFWLNISFFYSYRSILSQRLYLLQKKNNNQRF